MSVLKKLLFFFLVVFAIMVVVSLFLRKDFETEVQYVLHSPIPVVWDHIVNLEKFATWDPWNSEDTTVIRSFQGTPGSVGSSYSWEGHDAVIPGIFTIMESKPMEYIRYDLQLYQPYEQHAQVDINLKPTIDGNTEVKWHFKTRVGPPANLFLLLGGIEGVVYDDFKTGLERLNAKCQEIPMPVGTSLENDAEVME